jgi:2-deoxy-D-gluconate 3-dehydrogenase
MTPSTAPATQASLAELIDLSGRTAIVTGGAMGIGLGIALRLAEAGADLVLADRDREAAEAALVEVGNKGRGEALAVPVDVSNPNDVERMIGAAVYEFGAVDILVNNAGIYPARTLRELDLQTFRHVLDVNLTGLFLCTKAASGRMIDQGTGGRIVNITSIDALHPSMVGLASYDASKHGAWGFTKNVALELAPHGIWVNAIAPGGIRTPGAGDTDPDTLARFEAMIPMGRLGDPDEIGRAALFLASDLSGYMTGAQLVVDGGRLLT